MGRLYSAFYSLTKGQFRAANTWIVIGSFVVICLIVGGHVTGTSVSLANAAAQTYLVVLVTFAVLLQSRTMGRLAEIRSAQAVEGAIARLGYAPRHFYMDGAAATPSLQLIVLKCLEFCRPRHILELGSGQTTKILNCYVQANPDARVLTLEDSQTWMDILSADLVLNGRHAYRHAPLHPATIEKPGLTASIATRWYAAPPELTSQRFGFVLVDGPRAAASYSRSGILQYIPECLEDRFVVLFDDTERYAEKMTADAFEQILRTAGRRFSRFEIHGVKAHTVFCSPDYGFLRSI